MAARIGYLALGLAVIVLLWEGLIHVFGIPNYVLPGLEEIARVIWADFNYFARAVLATISVAGRGYPIGALVGVALAVAFVMVPTLSRILMPLVVSVNAVPTVAYAPLFIVALGIGAASKIAMVALAVGFTVFVNAFQGLKSTDPAALNLLRSYGAGSLTGMWMYRLPAALPAITNGLRVSVVRSILIAIIAEMLAAQEGIGRVIFESTQQLEFLRVWGAIVLTSIASMALYAIVVSLDHRFVWWK